MPRWAVAKAVAGVGVVRRALLVALATAMGEATGGLITGRESGAGVMGAAKGARANTGAGVSSEGKGG